MAAPIPRQLLNTSWTLHRLSPLHHGKEFQTLLNNPIALKTYAKRLRDHLTGDMIGGINTGFNDTATTDDDALSKTGALKECTWETISGWSYLDENAPSNLSVGSDSILDPPDHGRVSGILIALEYEFTIYKAALLAPPPRSEESEGSGNRPERRSRRKTESTSTSTYLPLLLTRFPNPLRQTFISFLSANFDTYCSLLRLPSSFLCAGLETYLNVLISDGSAMSQSVLEEVVKEVQLTLNFSPSVAPALRTLNIGVPRETLIHFITSGGQVESGGNVRNPFLGRLNAYLETHLAMKLDLTDFSDGQSLVRKQVRLSKVACGAFVLGTEGKMKLVATTNLDSAGDTSKVRDREQLILRASEGLLRAAISKAIAGER
ncbi:hypothetical protein MPDQ_004850 [Monascus purpureus]|uniref:Uncharacterized protein n=1 Tax=Monascus purpureus TaxID=5098 RepID=A0A507QKT9_MONPU|nr:hypothetical protein MPDQ_004850 [Monascus purpureus]BDD60042.1 hypothetical protein MAP00_005206 [Monascus purpureus]